MSSLEHWCSVAPVATVSTALFFAVAGWLLLFKRSWVAAKFAPPVPSTHVYFGVLDSYRGFAACLVVLAHMYFWCYPVFHLTKQTSPYLISYGGNKAVPLFVMLSGFLIIRSVRKIQTGNDLKEYTHRRFFRIVPLYLVTAVTAIAVGQMSDPSVSKILSELFMLRSLGYPTFTNPPAWSLYVEVCFYVFLPIFVVFTGRWVIPTSAIAFVVFTFADPSGSRELRLWKFFFAGILVSAACASLGRLNNRYFRREVIALTLVACGVRLLAYDFLDKDWFATDLKLIPKDTNQYSIGLALGFGLLMTGSLYSRLVAAIVGLWPLRVLGTISYSIYLVHPFYFLAAFPCLAFNRIGQLNPGFEPIGVAPWWYGFFVFFPGLLLWSGVSYLLFERPFQQIRPKAVDSPQQTTDYPVIPPYRSAA